MTPFGFCFGEGWRKMCCGGKAEINLRKSVSTASTVTILFLLLKRFHAEPSRLGCNFGCSLFPFVKVLLFCELGAALKSNTNVLCMERDEPSWFLNVWSAAFCGAFRGARPGPALRNHQFVSTSHMPWANIRMVKWFVSVKKKQKKKNGFSVPKSKELLSPAPEIQKHTDLISSKHFQNPSYTQLSLPVSDIPFRVKALCLLSLNKMPAYSSRGSHVSNHRGWLGRKVHLRENPSSILLVWTWANSPLSLPWQPFSLPTVRPLESPHSLNQGWWQQTKHPHPWIEHEHFSRNT